MVRLTHVIGRGASIALLMMACGESSRSDSGGDVLGTWKIDSICGNTFTQPDMTACSDQVQMTLNCSMLEAACSCHVVEGPITSTSNSAYTYPPRLPFGSDAEYCRDGDTLTLRFASESTGVTSYLVLVPAT